MLEHTGSIQDMESIKGFCEGIQDIVEKAKRENCFENIGDYISRICRLSCTYRTTLMPDMINVSMAVKVCEGNASIRYLIPVHIYIIDK